MKSFAQCADRQRTKLFFEHQPKQHNPLRSGVLETTMNSQEDLLASFRAITGEDVVTASRYLSGANGNLEVCLLPLFLLPSALVSPYSLRDLRSPIFPFLSPLSSFLYAPLIIKQLALSNYFDTNPAPPANFKPAPVYHLPLSSLLLFHSILSLIHFLLPNSFK